MNSDLDFLLKCPSWEDIPQYASLSSDVKDVIIDTIPKLSSDDSKSDKQRAYLVMVRNVLIPVPVVTDYLIGPISFSEHVSKDLNMHIYVLGDRHVAYAQDEIPQGKKVMEVQDYLYETVKHSPKFIDIFAEIHLQMKEGLYDYGDARLYLSKIQDKFQSCGSFRKKSCELSNLRLHISDIRMYDETSFLGTFSMIAMMWAKLDISKTLDLKFLNMLKVFFMMPEFNGKNTVSDFTDLIMNSIDLFPKVSRQRSKLPKQFEHVSAILTGTCKVAMTNLDYYQSIQNENLPNYINKLITQMGNAFTRPYTMLFEKQKFETIGLCFLLTFTCLMDNYLIYRLFKKFDEKEGKYSGPVTHAIIYAGNRHCTMYRNVFNALKFEEVVNLTSETQRIDMSSVRQPLFMD